MGKQDARYTLEGMIEMDEGYFTVESSQINKAKSNVAIMAESTPLEEPGTGEKSS